jgi:glycosyltransferase involved in cell wall biosynthesis
MPRDYFYELSARQVARGHKVDVLTWNRNGSCSVEKVAEGFTIHRLSGLNLTLSSIIQDYPFLPTLPAILEMLKPDVVHAESHLFLPTLQAVKKARKLGLPCVVTVHGVFADRGFALNFAQATYIRTLGSEVFKNVDRIICLTRSDAEEIVHFGGPLEKIRLIPNAVDTELFKPGQNREANLIVWVGRFMPEKGLKYLIEAARIVVKELKDVKFMLVGYGPSEANIMKLAFDYGLLNDNVYFTGQLDRNQIADNLSKASIAVLPSLKEGLPLSLLEAMSCGVAVVTSKIAGITEIVRDNYDAILVPPKKPELLARALVELLKNKKLRENIGFNARRSAQKKYNWHAVMSATEKLYCEISRCA